MAVTVTGYIQDTSQSGIGSPGKQPSTTPLAFLLSDGRTIPYSQYQAYQSTQGGLGADTRIGADVTKVFGDTPAGFGGNNSAQIAALQEQLDALTAAQTATPTTPDPNNPAGIPVSQYMAQQVKNPTLVNGTEFTPTLQTLQNGELMTGANSTLDNTNPDNYLPNAQGVTAPTVNASTGTAYGVNPNDALGMVNPNSGQMTAQTGNNVAQGTAAQGQVNELDTIQGQLKKLYADTTSGETPLWAQGAVNQAENILAARGLGASSIGAAAITAAIQSSAINIAAGDAATYFQMNMANLSNQQQMGLENLKNRQQGLLSDQSAKNAAEQFNAANEQQVQQFMATLVQNIQTQNADRAQAMSQFNASQQQQANQVQAQYDFNAQTFNAQQQQAINEFNATLRNQREQFNATNQFAIEQSNVLWRRSINTANTAAVNAANQANVQNRYNISQTALNNIWQQYRDEASWQFTASENEKNRQFNLAAAANDRSFLLQQQTAADKKNKSSGLLQAAGAFAAGLLL